MKVHSSLLRERFLVVKKPLGFATLPSVQIEEGYFLSPSERTYSLRSQGGQFFLILEEKKRKSLQRAMELTEVQFKALWPLTQGRRLCFKRTFFSIKKCQVIMDTFLGEHAPLVLAEVIFPTMSQSKKISHLRELSFLGENITHQKEYEPAFMALYGRVEVGGITQIGVLPYLFKEDELQVLIITNASGNRWIVPKGSQEPQMTPHEVALMEAVEEGGVLGTVRHDLHISYPTSAGRFLKLYTMKISKLLSTWPEDRFRQRKLLPLKQALQLIDDPSLLRAMIHLARLIQQ